MAINERITQLVIRGRDEYSRVLKNLEDQQKRVAASGVAAQRKLNLEYTVGTRRALQETQGEIRKLAAEFRTLSQAEGDNRAQIAQVVIAKAKLQAKAQELKTALTALEQATGRVTQSQKSSFAEFSRSVTAMEREAQASARSAIAAQRRADLQQRLNAQTTSGFRAWSQYVDAVDRVRTADERAAAIAARKLAIQQRLNAQVTSGFRAWSQATSGIQQQGNAAQATAAKLNILTNATNRATAAQQKLAAAPAAGGRATGAGQRTAKDNRKAAGAFGLEPWQLVNLGYQVNDVVSGLAMGQNPMQVLAQQAGQFVQIWPQAMTAIARGIPVLAAATAVMAPFIAALIRVQTEANSVKLFASNLRLLADGSNYSAQGLAKMAAQLDQAGLTIEEARAGLLELVKLGFNEADLRPIADMAQQLSKVSGKSFEDEVKRIGEAFKGNAASVRDLDRELKFLTASQLEQIYALERSGDKTGAMAVAQEALRNKLAATRKELTPWQNAIKNLGEAWNTFVGLIADSKLFQDFMRDLGQLAQDFERIAKGINAASNWMQRNINPTAEQRYQSDLAQRNSLEADLQPYRSSDDPFYRMQAQALEDQLVEVNKRIKEYEDAQKSAAAATAATGAAAGVIKTQTEEEKKIRLDMQQAIEDQLDQLRRESDLASQTKREQFIRNQLLEAQNKAKERGLELDTAQLEVLRQQAGATFDSTDSVMATGNYGSIVDRIVGVESSGKTDAKNPNSTATGLGQFIESTWISMFEKYFPDRAASMSREAILALRKDAEYSTKMVELYARENAKVLQNAGVAVNDAAVYLAHFLGPQGAIATLKADPAAPTDSFLSAGQINANQSILQGKNAQQVIAWAQRKMAATDAEVEATSRLNELDAERLKKQDDYLKGYNQRLADQQFELKMASESARQAAIQKAIRDEELKAQEAGVKLTEKQRADITATAAALFDRQNAETRVNELLERRSQLAESLQIAQNAGDQGQVQNIIEQIRGTEDELSKAIDAAIAFYEALGGPEAEAAILRLKNVKATVGDVIKDLETQFLPTAEDLNEQMADMGGNAFSALAEAWAQGKSAWTSFKDAVLQGLGEILIGIGQAIVKQALFNALSGGAAGGGFGGAVSSWITGLFHSGGVIGLGGAGGSGSRMVDPNVFAGASRYHGGGTIGRLGPKEVPIIALEGEEVLTENNPRHSANGGGQVNVKNVNVFDSVDVLEASLNTEPGQKVVLNFMTKNPRKIKQALGI
ncbi:phage tail length tape measure family protein [Paracoccus yeei]|uniref:phage tail length tape measure family protein n=1 Tax=Paracoccus yeei TaxID=147645 RepID=UPI00174BC7B9|nr:phage tail length tape measure family protein [Paracoccus yeei]